MDDMHEAGLILGKAIGELKTRVKVVEDKEPSFNVPVPSVENVLPEMQVTVEPAKLEQTIEVQPANVDVKIPEFPDFPEIDMAGIIEAIAGASVAGSIETMSQQIADAAKIQAESQASFQQVMVDLVGVIKDQQAEINSLVLKVDTMGGDIVNVLSAPKELILDRDGDPIGVQIVGRQLN